MSLHVVLGSGPVGTAVARLLADEGEKVRVITRSGTGPAGPAIELVAGDATDAAALADLSRGAVAIYNCANPAYDRWAQLWPPLGAAVLTAAERVGAVLATMSNLYGYGPVDGPMTESLPLAATSVKGRVRATQWEQALAAHASGRVRATEVRASDFLGARTRSMLTEYLLPKVLRGEPVRVPADLDAPHSFAYPGDAARTLIAVARDERAWGQPWHAPHDAPATIRDVAQRAVGSLGGPLPRLNRVPIWLLRAASLGSSEKREFVEVAYQFNRPLVVDSSRAETTFGLVPTPLGGAITETVAALTASPGRP